MDNEFKEVETGHEVMVPPIADNSIVSIADTAEQRFDAIVKIKKIALKVTNRFDWVDQNGKPYLQASGAEKVARLFGISWRISEPEIEHLEGGHYTYTYKGEFSLAGTTIEAIGTRSSKDGFFKKYHYPGGTKTELPASEIDRGDVKKSAYTNLLGNGITRLLGIRNLSYEDLAEYAGISKEQIGAVEYKKQGGKDTTKGNGKAGIQNPEMIASEAQIKAIHSMLGKLNITDDEQKCAKAAAILELPEVPTSISKLNKGQASKVIEELQGELNK